MDYKHIVETNEAYSEKNLNENDKQFIAGMRWIVEKVVENFLANCFVGEPESIREKLEYEIVESAIDELKQHIEGNIYEMIVSMLERDSCDC